MLKRLLCNGAVPDGTLPGTEQGPSDPLQPPPKIPSQVVKFFHHGLSLQQIVTLMETGLEALTCRFVLLAQHLLVFS